MHPLVALLSACWSSASHHPATLFFLFALAILLLYFTLQRPLSSAARRGLSTAFVLTALATIKLSSMPSAPFRPVLVPFLLTGTLQGICMLCMEGRVIKLGPGPVPLPQRFRAVYRISTNIRRLSLFDPDDPWAARLGTTSRVKFALSRCGCALFLLAAFLLGNALIAKTMSVLHVIPSDFGLNKQALLPPTGLRGICLRSAMSVSWIWNSYSLLTSSHDLLAVLFVSVIRWDRPDEWPPLFGSITDATSQRRFWGVFWHRLHVSLFDRCMSHAAVTVHRLWLGSTSSHSTTSPQQLPSHRQHSHNHHALQKAARALGMFCMSAACHAASNWVVMGRTSVVGEFRFFISNWFICLLETVIDWFIVRRLFPSDSLLAAPWKRLLGYIWTMFVIACLTPAW